MSYNKGFVAVFAFYDATRRGMILCCNTLYADRATAVSHVVASLASIKHSLLPIFRQLIWALT